MELGLRVLPPARFRQPIKVVWRAEVLPPPPRPRRRIEMGLFALTLAVSSLALAGWNAYWLIDSTGLDIAASLRSLLG